MAVDDWLRITIYGGALVWMVVVPGKRLYPPLARISIRIDSLPEAVQKAAYAGTLAVMVTLVIGACVVYSLFWSR
jgi:hypothetical protein